MSKFNTCDIDRLCEEFRKILLKETHAHGWGEWRGSADLLQDEPVQICWPNGIIRTYERADMINWKNLPTDGSVRWRQP